jgi:hypothetical protein
MRRIDMSVREEESFRPEYRLDAGAGRRGTLVTMGLGLAASVVGLATMPSGVAHAAGESLLPAGAKSLQEFTMRLSQAPRRRDFKTVPTILDDPGQWDHAALSEVIAYRGGPKQAWNNTEIAGPWLNGMRNALNSQIWAFRHPDFLAVSATHGTAHLALFDAAVWEKYQLRTLTGGKFGSNTLAEARVDANADANDYQDAEGPFSPHDNSIPTLQRRGVAFLACHNAILEIAAKLIVADVNPDKLSQAALGAELTNHLIPGVVLTPGVAGTLVELQHAGFSYAA